MKNLDLMQEKRTEIMQNLATAMASNDEAKVNQALEDMSKYYSDIVTEQISGAMQEIDKTVLAGRGVRQLTSNETAYYQKLIEASKSSNPKQAITDIDKAFPETIIDTVLEDVLTSHPLLNAVNFQNTSMLTRFIINDKATQKAKWGAIGLNKTSTGVSELEGEITDLSLSACKLFAYMTVSQDLLDAGPAWVDRYVRAVLTDALALGIEDAIVNGTGVNQPIGMKKKNEVDSSTHEYKDQTATAVTEITPETFGALVQDLAKTPTGRPRSVDGLILVVNPGDYYKKIVPATTVMAPDGTYRSDVLPVKCEVIQSEAVAANSAILGIGKNYFMGIGLPKNGKLEYDDSAMFLEDCRAYKIKLIGNGRPVDFASFKLLNITNLKPLAYSVKTVTTA